MFMYVRHMCAVPVDDKRGIRNPGTEVADNCDLLMGTGNQI